MKQRNPERQAKRRKRYQKYLASATWKMRRLVALSDAGYQCEYQTEGWGMFASVSVGEDGKVTHRCPETDDLHVHHLSYARMNGTERPEDLQVLCKPHHRLEESQKPHKMNRRGF